MASSTFEVRESESDSEKVLDFGLDTCEENGIMSTHIDGELPKDHTYTKEPDVLQEDEVKESDNSNNQLDEMDNNIPPANKSRPSRTTKTQKAVRKTAAKGKSKKNSPVKKETVSKRNKSKKEDVIEEVSEEVANNGDVESTSASPVAEEQSKPAKRGRKRKIEEKENVLEQEDNDADVTEEPTKKRNAASVKTPKNNKSPKGKVSSTDDGIIDKHNLPKGWVRKTVVRKSGKSAGQVDIYIYSPDGYKFRSKPDIAAYLHRTKSSLKLDNFDFTRKKAAGNSSVTLASTKKKATPVKAKSPSTKKKSLSTPKKSPKLLVKIVSTKSKRNKAAKKSLVKEAKQSKVPVRGKKNTKAASKGTKKNKSS